MKREALLFATTALATLLLALLLIRWLAPQLLGIPIDLQLVRVAEEVPPFLEGVFRTDDFESEEFLIKDPHMPRARPLFPDKGTLGPHDLLGFRNRSIPNVADIITIGDSQTYGVSALLERNWPSQLASELPEKSSVTYNLATGGWGAAEYLEVFQKSLFFRPRVVMVAFYTGNDPLESFRSVYGKERLAFLRPEANLAKSDAPKAEAPTAESDRWKVTFNDGVTTEFTPGYRLASNLERPAIQAGYVIMAEVARRIHASAAEVGVHVLFTIIPTKELVYAKRVEEEGLEPPEDYLRLVRNEHENIRSLADQLDRISDSAYVDVLKPLRDAALRPVALYKSDIDGHPLESGYGVIAQTLAPRVGALLPARPQGGIKVPFGPYDGIYLPAGADRKIRRTFLVRENRLWIFESRQVFEDNGWERSYLRQVTPRDIENIPYAGVITTVDPERFGPTDRERAPMAGRAR